MKRIREMDLKKDKPSVACCNCEKQPQPESAQFWVQVGFVYQCSPCSRQAGLVL